MGSAIPFKNELVQNLKPVIFISARIFQTHPIWNRKISNFQPLAE